MSTHLLGQPLRNRPMLMRFFFIATLLSLFCACHAEKRSRKNFRTPANRADSEETPQTEPTPSPEQPEDPSTELTTLTSFTALFGEGSHAQNLWLASRTGSSGAFIWFPLVASNDASSASDHGEGSRLERASTTLTGPIASTLQNNNAITTTFLTFDQDDLRSPQLSLKGATVPLPRGSSNIDLMQAAPDPWNIFATAPLDTGSMLATHASGEDLGGRMTSLIGINTRDGRSLLVTVRASEESFEPPQLIEQTTANEAYEAIALARDYDGILHATYVRGGKLFDRYLEKSGAGPSDVWSPANPLAQNLCRKVSQVKSVAGSPSLPFALAYTCDTGNGCTIGFTAFRGRSGSPRFNISDHLVGTTDSSSPCLPFRFTQPAIAISYTSNSVMDATTRVHIASPLKVNRGAISTWDMGYTEADATSLAFFPFERFFEKGNVRGMPRLSIDPRNAQVFLTFVKDNEVRLASKMAGQGWINESIVPDVMPPSAPQETAANSFLPQGRILDLSDLVLRRP
jgi:hypothetical protein